MRKIIIYKGSNRGFSKYLNDNKIVIKNSFASIIIKMDKERKAVKSSKTTHQTIVIKDSDYFAITNNANNNLLSILEEVSAKDSVIVIHNPQNYIESEMLLHYPKITTIIEESITGLEEEHILKVISNNSMFTKWKMELLKTLLYFSSNDSQKPYVILLYGGSGLGKTHILKELVKEMNEELLSFQLSNFQDTNTIGILLGEKFPSKDVYSQIKLSSNSLILLDEFDKIHSFGYNAFYDIFDEPVASSDFVSVNIKNRIFIATTNYSNMEEIEQKLPNPIVNRINKFIHVPDLSIQEINKYIDSKKLDSDLKEEVQLEVNKLENVNLRIIDNIIEEIKINKHWDNFISRITTDVEGEKNEK
ncbi:ATP-binding protein [Mollicutes bacterium LVI A0078]|nr:ATP-binding protein [Mollicutes bacterium LVI A0075]WOO91137.1 ATP-binding protein [Mollicutes bacterium LVI A0078]